MSKEFFSESLDREEMAILTAIDRIASGGAEALETTDMDPADARTVREYMELLALLPYELEPSHPSIGTKVRLLAAISETGVTQPSIPLGTQVEAGAQVGDRAIEDLTFRGPIPSREAAEVTWRRDSDSRSVDVTLAGRSAQLPAPAALRPAASSSGQWMSWALAAVLGMCLLGVGYLYGRTEEQQSTIADLRSQLQEVPVQRAAMEALEDELSTLHRRHEMMTRVATRAYPMRSVGGAARGRGAHQTDGIIYVCGQHQRWYLNVTDLEPPPQGMEYHLWFMTVDGPVSGGPIRVGEDSTAEMDAQSMPIGTQGFTITLEKSGPHEQPEGAMILLGEEAVSL